MPIIGIFVLVLIAAWWIYIFKSKNVQPVSEDNIAPPPPAVLNSSSDPNGPQVIFPENARSDNPEINNFVVEFVNLLLANDYKGYRLKVTQQREPINMKTFNEAYGRVKSIEIKEITKVEDRKTLKAANLDDLPGPIYQVRVHVVLRNKLEWDRELTLFQEQGHWVSSN
ncbi:MAG: hypothetical protein WC975_03405 [Phycisphaerae bacterium]